MFLDYIKERYDADYFKPLTLEQVVEKYSEELVKRNVQVLQTEDGFVTYRFEGDAVIFFDMFIKKGSRNSGLGWVFLNDLIKQGLIQGKKVAITFSDHHRKNRHLGLATIEAFGFVQAFETKRSTVFIKGIY